VDERQLRPEARLPSIRQFAATHDVSKFTVVQAYDRLVASGHIQSRLGSGFFVSKPAQSSERGEGGTRLDRATDVLWLLRRLSGEANYKYQPGSGTLPPAWLEDSGLNRAMRAISRRQSRSLLDGYGNPMGYAPLREGVSRQLAELGIDAPADQILLTNGIIGGIDLVGRYLIRHNDLVLVDDPGYYHTFGHLRAMGAAIQGVPWTSTGPDLEKLEDLARTWRPRLLVTSPIVHNPTGRSISQGTAFRLLRLAERYDFYIVEDDVDGAYHPDPRPRLAGLDQLNRVIYMCGFSKALSPRLRVGAVAAHRDLIRDLVDLKMLTQMASSEFTEKLVHEVLAHGQFRKHRAKLLDNLHQFRGRAIRRLEAIGIGPVGDDTHGLFAWMDIPGVTDTTPLAEAAIKRGIVLAPGAMFSPYMTSSTKMRFNVTYCRDDAMFRELETLLSTATNT
jgi:DNA-binding transcriptional MocR family regulator